MLTLKNGEELEETVNRAHGNPADPLTDAERSSASSTSARRRWSPEEQRNRDRRALRRSTLDSHARRRWASCHLTLRGRDSAAAAPASGGRMTYDVVVKDGRIVDGTGKPALRR